jgi:hypothetical protein
MPRAPQAPRDVQGHPRSDRHLQSMRSCSASCRNRVGPAGVERGDKPASRPGRRTTSARPADIVLRAVRSGRDLEDERLTREPRFTLGFALHVESTPPVVVACVRLHLQELEPEHLHMDDEPVRTAEPVPIASSTRSSALTACSVTARTARSRLSRSRRAMARIVAGWKDARLAVEGPSRRTAAGDGAGPEHGRAPSLPSWGQEPRSA